MSAWLRAGGWLTRGPRDRGDYKGEGVVHERHTRAKEWCMSATQNGDATKMATAAAGPIVDGSTSK